MRGRLAVLLIAVLVLPLLGIAWLGYSSLRASSPAELHDDDRLAVAAQAALNGAVTDLRTRLSADLAELALRVAHGSAGAGLPDLPAGERPALAELVTDGGASLPEPLRLALDAELRSETALRGWRNLPLGDAEVLCEVVVEPRAAGRFVALRPLSGSLSLESFADSIGRAVLLADGSRLAVGSVRGAQDALQDEARRRELWERAEAGDQGAQLQREGDQWVAALPLPTPLGRTAALVLAAAPDEVLFPLLDQRGAALAQARASLAWMAAAGVVLALVIGLLAPRFVWSDIRGTTDFIFASVERLRELVSRIGLALSEQTRVLRSLSASVARLDSDSQQIARTGRALAHSAEQSQWTSQSGHQKAESAQRTVLDMRERVEEIERQMEELDRRCAAIGSILVYVDHLTSETDVVSINATIQAADAGGGRQLSAMAAEIQKLTELAAGCTREIRQQVEEIQDASRTTAGATRDGRQQVERCQAAFEDVEQNFGRILRWVEDTKRSAEGIEGGTARQSESLQSVSRDVEAIEQRSHETAANFEAVVDAADELADLGRRINETWKVG